MYTVYLAGGIASGKSTVAAELERLGAYRIDLDQLSREILSAENPVTQEIARAFGDDLIDEATGELDRSLLAKRAFASDAARQKLEGIELPAIAQLLRERLAALRAEQVLVCVVEVPLLDRALDLLTLADEVLCVVCPREERLRRAISRGMDPVDAAARMEHQVSDEWLVQHADSVIRNTGTTDDLERKVLSWWQERERGGWAPMKRGDGHHAS